MVEYSLPVGVASGFALGLITAFFTRRITWGNASPRPYRTMLKYATSGKLKLVLVIRTDLGMRKGKIAAQCAHAVIGCYKVAQISCPELLEQWEQAHQPKVILQHNEKGENSLLALRDKAREANLVVHVIRDAGRTQVAKHSATVLGIGPGPADVIDPIVKHLKRF